MMTVMLNLTQFVYWRCKISRRGTCWNIYNPVLWVFISAVLVNVQPMMILVNGSFQICCAPCATFGLTGDNCPASGMSLPPWGDGKARSCNWSGNQFWDESYCDGSKLPTFPSKLEGWMIQIFCTWGGFVFMFVGILQATQLHRVRQTLENHQNWPCLGGSPLSAPAPSFRAASASFSILCATRSGWCFQKFETILAVSNV